VGRNQGDRSSAADPAPPTVPVVTRLSAPACPVGVSRSPHGRGRAWHLSIKHTPETERLAQALLAAGEASARKR